jgi:hypothetical protein
MELALIAFVGTALLMAAELGHFAGRRRPTSVTAEASSAAPLFARSRAAKSWAADYADFYDFRTFWLARAFRWSRRSGFEPGHTGTLELAPTHPRLIADIATTPHSADETVNEEVMHVD